MSNFYWIKSIRRVRYDRRSGRAREFLVRWKGYAPKYDSWITKDSLECSVEEFCREWDLQVYRQGRVPWPGIFEPVEEDALCWEVDV